MEGAGNPKMDDVSAESGPATHQAQDSPPQLNSEAGTAGVAGWPEHHAPVHGRGGA
jgi:hypothetical protein